VRTPAQRVASSFDAVPTERWQTIVKIARSTPTQPRPLPATRLIALPPRAGPQLANHVRTAALWSGDNWKPAGCTSSNAVRTAEEALDRSDKAGQRGAVQEILAAQVVNHLRDRHAPGVALIVGEREIAHDVVVCGLGGSGAIGGNGGSGGNGLLLGGARRVRRYRH
jgi:hypothetical protein